MGIRTMSLINKMLQDLDARGGQPGAATVSPEIKPVPPQERAVPWLRLALLGALLAVLGGSGYMAWRMTSNTAPEAPEAPQAAEVPVNIGDGQSQTPTIVPAPAPVPAGSAPASPAAAPALSEEAAPEPAAPAKPPVDPAVPRLPDAGAALAEDAKTANPAQRDSSVMAAARERPANGAPRQATASPVPKKAQPTGGSGVAPARQPSQVDGATGVPAAQPAAKPAAKPATAPAAKATAGRSETTAQRAENAYRRALAGLEDGRVTEAIRHLEEALRAEPRHEAARQTLVSLLIEAKRPEEAIRQLGAALALDPAQPAMAMLLARLQLERGSPGIDTLMRTLPHAAGNADYRAFLAGALQHEERHREAIHHYLAALRISPRNGVWWMGLGISLQADKREPEAAAAFQRALDSGALSADLRGFVERKLKGLAR
jgi:MSHA biogenesis protein MshN